MKHLAACIPLALACAAPACADVYRWRDQAGQVHYSDQPPPASIAKAKRLGAAPAAHPEGAATLPPVLLYNAQCGKVCDQAVEFLNQRAIPYTLKNIDQDSAYAAELYQRTGAHQVPVLYLGDSAQRGYSAPIWDKMLEQAGYSTAVQNTAAEPAKDNAP